VLFSHAIKMKGAITSMALINMVFKPKLFR